jgi:Na+-transporting NADH:ubiquinone oxidoreductase subunit C
MPDDSTTPAPARPQGWLGRLRSMPNDSTAKTLLVAITLCLVCSVIVSSAAVGLKPRQQRNAEEDRRRIILEVAGLMEPGKSINELFEQVEPRVVDLVTGTYAEGIDPDTYNQRAAAKDPAESVAIPSAQDIASIRRRANAATVYLVHDNGTLKRIVLPVYGYGLWSTLYGYIALEGDGNTIFGLQYYEHGETAGLGGEVDNPKWRAKWKGKVVYGSDGAPDIEVAKGTVGPDDPIAQFRVDGLAGATLTSNGVTNMLRYWLGDEGFGPFLRKLRSSA